MYGRRLAVEARPHQRHQRERGTGKFWRDRLLCPPTTQPPPPHPPLTPTLHPLCFAWRDIAAMVYIRQDKLPKLNEYKYSGVDHSLVSRYVMKPFYNNVVIHCFPEWMA